MNLKYFLKLIPGLSSLFAKYNEKHANSFAKTRSKRQMDLHSHFEKIGMYKQTADDDINL